MKKFLLILGLVAVFSIQESSAQKWAIKSNLLYDATTSMNIGFETALAEKWTFDMSGNRISVCIIKMPYFSVESGCLFHYQLFKSIRHTKLSVYYDFLTFSYSVSNRPHQFSVPTQRYGTQIVCIFRYRWR